MSGAFQSSREIFNNPIWKNIVEFRLFYLIYGNAIFAQEGYKVSETLILKRGEWCRSTRKIQEDLSYIENRQIKTYSTSVINRCIKKLEREQRVCTRTHELGTVFTVLNYDKYQGFGRYTDGNLEHNLEQHQNSVGTVLEQSGNNNKNVKKEKKEKKVEEVKNNYAEFVTMTETEYQKLISEHGEDAAKKMISTLDNYKGSKGKTYKSDYRAILMWVIEKVTTSSTSISKSGTSYASKTEKKSELLNDIFWSDEDEQKRSSGPDETNNKLLPKF